MKKIKGTKHQRKKKRGVEERGGSSTDKANTCKVGSDATSENSKSHNNTAQHDNRDRSSSSSAGIAAGSDVVVVDDQEISSGDLALHLAKIAEIEASRAVEDAYRRHVEEMKLLLTNHYNVKVWISLVISLVYLSLFFFSQVIVFLPFAPYVYYLSP